MSEQVVKDHNLEALKVALVADKILGQRHGLAAHLL